MSDIHNLKPAEASDGSNSTQSPIQSANPLQQHTSYDPVEGAHYFKEETQLPPPPSHVHGHWPWEFVELWWLEAISVLLMAASLMAIILILALHEGQPLPNWPFQVSINTLISIPGAVMKGTMLLVVGECIAQLKWIWFKDPRPLVDMAQFDEASRGPLGALYLLLGIWYRSFKAVLPLLAAIITLLAVAMDPFTQQIVRYSNCTVVEPNGGASIPRVAVFANRTGLYFTEGQPTIRVSLEAAITSGLYSRTAGISITAGFICPGGDCDFGQYYSTGVCSQCVDITSSITKDCDTVGLGINTGCNYTLPSGVTVHQSGGDFATTPEVFAASSSISEKLGVPKSLQGFALTHTIAEMSNYTFFDPWIGSTVSVTPRNQATECMLYPCGRTYESTVRGGKLTETLIDEQPLPQNLTITDESEADCLINIPCLPPGLQSDVRNGRTKFSGSPQGRFWYQPSNCSEIIESFPEVAACRASFDQNQAVALSIFFFGDGFNSPGPFIEGSMRQHTISDVGAGVGASQVAVLYNQNKGDFEYISDVFGDIATSITEYLRRSQVGINGDEKFNVPHNGTVLLAETCVSVRWGWLTLPAALVVATCALFATTLIRIHRKAQWHVWKDGTLALLFRGLSYETRARRGVLEASQEMELEARNMQVQLRYTDAGWRLIDTNMGHT